ncbi:D-aminoacyl-tRNA deacylase-like isoform X2 [Daktulosphaira vitifoliae]|uniref:D-aminoacyl-tRNA deacylase-like isoform X1 n=1 Tax=Daktulosphaira vitifoliae TaxID=58002 RepID=UPI0021AA660D|nr:D-aminoacyl-tRNA deacylase-like isoform X1 [Daktulosphaira vitifoliae]XP_050520365.1 D-aminoacyl-tRNA deacylase-like isoform X1 [Daktulosphaira vitifoliae]XP_050520366.1 D-aminoacyl-tRNA deacylase-like isoform X1 [Daktulosphaira vitifoliae]XP_050520367.1 D-aminoacyl-tRNA deacylase-like isoform X1 [Daktulosphaira vitifoliae]XP_050531996.1 D-aminoacyl-tRNA deacylase-like isoform X2 [Daktulosphaira vitifoliae]XP_050532787.1 D-aminoacyl-tRNA deacylase-like isoform X2 [Daktulosphaira vitifoliae]
MKVVVQRVLRAKVTVDSQEVNSIKNGLCLLVGLHKFDQRTDIDYMLVSLINLISIFNCKMVQKILKLRLFDDEGKKWHANVVDMGYEILSISQFTLCYKLKGNKLDFHQAMPGDNARQNYQYFLDSLKNFYSETKIKDGVFGGKMEVEILNDGPVTVQLESGEKNSSDIYNEKLDVKLN